MTRRVRSLEPGLLLGIEGGATRTVALLTDTNGQVRQRLEAGPANLRLLDDAALVRHFTSLASSLQDDSSPLAAVAIGMAGARTESDRARIRRATSKVWPGVPAHATHDLETALRAAERLPSPVAARVLVLSGTGSCCWGLSADGTAAKLGGWGHLLGDKGSGYEIGLRSLKAVVYYFDRDGRWPALGTRLLRFLQLNEPDDLIGWIQSAPKPEIAALAVPVFQAWETGDSIAADILSGASASLARDAVALARRLAPTRSRVQFILSGSVLLKSPRFLRRVTTRIRQGWAKAQVSPLKRESAWGAVELARELWSQSTPGPRPSMRTPRAVRNSTAAAVEGLERIQLSPTEQRHPRSMHLDRLSLRQGIELMLSEDRTIPGALLKERASIEQGLKLVVRSFKKGGRLFYVGAGTSGRLGVLDASECPPTFRTDPEMVQGVIAGGQRALWLSVEGAEDDADAGGRAMEFRAVSRRDTVVGIAASGRTPYVWGALREARRRGAATILLCFNPTLSIPVADRPSVVIAPNLGPELLTGSTRLKAGTATKLVLNIFSTLAMVQLGKVLGNLMVDVQATNEKLRDRAVRIVRELTGANAEKARAALTRKRWRIKEACKLLK